MRSSVATSKTVRADDSFRLEVSRIYYGEPKELIQLTKDVDYLTLTDEDKQILDFVLQGAGRKNFQDFTRLVYSTYPIATQPRFSTLDLVGLAREYAETEAIIEDDPASMPMG